MKRRYSNFHRARKYHRKWLRRNRHDHLVDAGYYRDMYEKYDSWAYLNDGVNTGFENVGESNERLIILAHFDPNQARIEIPIELRYKSSDDMSKYFNFIDDCHQMALSSLGINNKGLEMLNHD